MPTLETFWRELHYSARGLAQSKGFTTIAVLTLALGIGANTAIFSVLQGVVLAPLPYHDPDRLVVVALYNRALKYATDLSYPDFLDWQRQSRSFDQIAAFKPQGYDLTSPGPPLHVEGKQISANFFRTLGVKLALGREISPDEDRFGGAPSVVLSNRLWQDRFASSPGALGKTVTLYGYGLTVVGVLPAGFRFGSQDADVYTALGRADSLYRRDRSVHDILCIARLSSGVTLDQARAEMDTVQDHIDRLNPATERGQGAYLDSLKHFFTGDVWATLSLLLGAVGLLLLIACANVANLLLARSASRRRESAVRLALGASRIQLARQLLSESLLLSITGGFLGLAAAHWGVRIVLAAAPAPIARGNIGVNGSVLLFALSIAIAAGILFGLLPALRSSKTDIHAALKQSGRGLAGGHRRVQDLLVVAQIALAAVLLAGGGLLVRSVRKLLAVNPGFDARNVITFQVGLSPAIAANAPKLRAAYQQLTERIGEIPGVESAGLTGLVPMGKGANEGPYWIGARPPASMAELPRAIWYPADPGYINAMSIPLLQGRSLSPNDTVQSETVVLIDTLLARRSFPDRDPIGQTITIPHWGAGPRAARVVGVVGHVKHYGLDGSTGEKPQIYYSVYQLPDEILPPFAAELAIVVHSRLDTPALIPAVRTVADRTGAGRPVYNVQTMPEIVTSSMDKQRFPMLLLVAFAILALLLASVGTYGVISYSTAQRIPEIGIRMALGAARGDVLAMVIRQGITLALAGLAIGAVTALTLGRALLRFSTLLYGISPADPITFVFVSCILVAAAILACYVPARRGARVDPMIALRHE